MKNNNRLVVTVVALLFTISGQLHGAAASAAAATAAQVEMKTKISAQRRSDAELKIQVRTPITTFFCCSSFAHAEIVIDSAKFATSDKTKKLKEIIKDQFSKKFGQLRLEATIELLHCDAEGIVFGKPVQGVQGISSTHGIAILYADELPKERAAYFAQFTKKAQGGAGPGSPRSVSARRLAISDN